MRIGKKSKISSFQLIISGFFSVILLGGLLLMTPLASATHCWTPFLNAIFTSTSAVCVTGLVVYDTSTYWSMFGQFIILLLIQIGGMGVVTVALAVTTLSGRKIGLMQKSTMVDAISAPNIGNIVKFTIFILKGIALIEALGALLLSTTFIPEFGLLKGVWYSIFHSVSAFCNAGFDLMGFREHFSSLTHYEANVTVNLTIMALIIVGGIGFLTWQDILTKKTKIHRYSMQTKVILASTIVLILIPAIYFFLAEMVEQRNLTTLEKGLGALFQAVTPRTAGFNTLDYGSFSENSILITIILMLIGGSPGSTAGGMKTTTFAVLLATSLSVFRRRNSAQFFGRRVSMEIVRDAATILMMYLLLFILSGMVIAGIEQVPLLTALFESASAIGTVGLTLGITPQLHIASKVILILLMFFGRVGGLTLIFATLAGERQKFSKLPKEMITVG